MYSTEINRGTNTVEMVQNIFAIVGENATEKKKKKKIKKNSTIKKLSCCFKRLISFCCCCLTGLF